MRLSTIVVCVLLLVPARTRGCFEYTSEATPQLSTPHRIDIEASAGEFSGERLRMAGAGVAAIALIAVVARGYRRAANRPSDAILPSGFRLDPVEFDSGAPHLHPMSTIAIAMTEGAPSQSASVGNR